MWRDDALLLDIRIAAIDACHFVEGMDWEDFQKSRLHQSAVVRCIEIIGEAASKVSPAVKDAQPDLPWSNMINMRHRLIHAYDVVRLDVVWNVIRNDLPPLIDAIGGMIPREEPEA